MSDVLAGVGASAALMLSSIPWNGPIATVRVGRINGKFIINPTRTELEDSDMEMVVSGNNETVVMVEGEADCVSETEMLDALKCAHEVIKDIIELQNDLVKLCDVVKDEIPVVDENQELISAVDQ